MKKRIENIFLAGICMLVLSACGSKEGKLKISDESLFAEHPSDKVLTVSDSVNKDTLNLDLPPYSTAALLNAKEYFRTNNKYKDWDPKNPQYVLISAIVEKDGTLTDMKVVKKCNDDLLNKEALRLIREAKIEPAKNSNGDYTRSRWSIVVKFPPE